MALAPLSAAPGVVRSEAADDVEADAPAATPTAQAGASDAFMPGAAQLGPPPDLPPPRLVGERFSAGNESGTIYDAQQYLAHYLHLFPGGVLLLFHHSDVQWGVPGEKTKIVVAATPGRNGAMWGPGFYTSTGAETRYGPFEFQLEIPIAAFERKKLYVPETVGAQSMPPGVDILLTNGDSGTWVIFKPGSDEWLNAAVTEARFDREDQIVGWD